MFQIRRPEGQLLAHRRREQHVTRALKNIPERVRNLRHAGLTRVFSIDQHAPRFWFQQSNRVFNKGRFARPIRTQHRDDIAAINFEINSVQDFDVCVVSKSDILKADHRLAVRARSGHARQDFYLRWGRVLPRALHDIARGQFHFAIVHHF